MKTILLGLWNGVIIAFKRFPAWVVYPIAYPSRHWVYEGSEVKNYTMPKKAQENWLAWFLWLFLDDDQINGYPDWYAKELIGKLPISKWDKFRCAYAWSAWRNPMYNINYNYLSNQSPIVSHEVVFGHHEWNKKLRASNSDDGVQLVWYTTAKGQKRFMFSVAMAELYKGKMIQFKKVNKWYKITPYIGGVVIPFTFYYGWNLDTNGRFSVAIKFK